MLDFHFPKINAISNHFIIEWNKVANNTQINIVSVEGKLVYHNSSINSNKIIINAKGWSKGVYYVKIINDKNNKTIKLIKQ